jgi:UDP-glucose 4-epimerase
VHSIREVVEIARRIRPDARVAYGAGGGSLSPYPVAYDDRAARAELGWAPDYTIEAAVAEHLRRVASR